MIDRVQDLLMTSPVALVPIVKRLGIRAITSKSLPPFQIGFIQNEMVIVNGILPKERQRFILCYLLAHWLLHKDYIGSGSFVDNSLSTRFGGIPDLNARNLAAEMIMPWHLIYEMLEKLGVRKEEVRYGDLIHVTLANKFRVSLIILANRLNLTKPMEVIGQHA